MRFAIGIEYDGTAYNGWQRQRAGVGVQSVIEQALAKVADHDVELTCAGRTDTGVHAVGQVAHFDSASERSLRGWVLGANSNLPDDVSVLWANSIDSIRRGDFRSLYSKSDGSITRPFSAASFALSPNFFTTCL